VSEVARHEKKRVAVTSRVAARLPDLVPSERDRDPRRPTDAERQPLERVRRPAEPDGGAMMRGPPLIGTVLGLAAVALLVLQGSALLSDRGKASWWPALATPALASRRTHFVSSAEYNMRRPPVEPTNREPPAKAATMSAAAAAASCKTDLCSASCHGGLLPRPPATLVLTFGSASMSEFIEKSVVKEFERAQPAATTRHRATSGLVGTPVKKPAQSVLPRVATLGAKARETVKTDANADDRFGVRPARAMHTRPRAMPHHPVMSAACASHHVSAGPRLALQSVRRPERGRLCRRGDALHQPR